MARSPRGSGSGRAATSLNELYEYVFDAVQARNPNQTPRCQVDMQGELLLARSPRQRIRAVPLPADLRAAMSDQNMYTRLGAVSELQARLTGGNLAAAAGAYEALRGMVNDIRYVAEPAAAAVAAAAIQPEPDRVSFGQVSQGDAVPAQRIRLTGPPIARAVTLRPSQNWIRCTLTADGFDVAPDTSLPGQFQGTVEVKGPTGRATITVDLDVSAASPEGRPAAEPAVAPSPVPPPRSTSGTKPLQRQRPRQNQSPRQNQRPRTPQQQRPLQHQRTLQSRKPRQRVGSFIRRWWNSPDTPLMRAAGAVISAFLLVLSAFTLLYVLGAPVAASYLNEDFGLYPWAVALALAGLVVAALERPYRWATTFVHALVAADSLVMLLYVIHLDDTDASTTSDRYAEHLQNMLGNTVIAVAIGAALLSVVLVRHYREVQSVFSLAILWLTAIGYAFALTSMTDASVTVVWIGIEMVSAAAAVALASAVVLLATRRRPEGTDQIPR